MGSTAGMTDGLRGASDHDRNDGMNESGDDCES
jgi:hypothetical protein